jgi:predicted Fe-Mo cluster-binding NifX family protein
MRVCVPISADGQVDPRWGRADRVAVAEVADGEIRGWQEFTVDWGTLHAQGTEGAHHARVARFLRDNQVKAIAVHHVGPGMMLHIAVSINAFSRPADPLARLAGPIGRAIQLAITRRFVNALARYVRSGV